MHAAQSGLHAAHTLRPQRTRSARRPLLRLAQQLRSIWGLSYLEDTAEQAALVLQRWHPCRPTDPAALPLHSRGLSARGKKSLDTRLHSQPALPRVVH